MKKKYFIDNVGCDDETIEEFEFAQEEVEFLKKVVCCDCKRKGKFWRREKDVAKMGYCLEGERREENE